LGDFPLPVPFDGERCLPCGLHPQSWRSDDGGCVPYHSHKLTEQPADDETQKALSMMSSGKCWWSPEASCCGTMSFCAPNWLPKTSRSMRDHVQLQQVLLNLIMNGVEAMRGVMERGKELAVS
jgi:hypothetical protein